MKWLGIIGIILITHRAPVYVLASMEWSNNDPLDYEVKVEANQTACSYLKQFDLQDFFTEYINFIQKVRNSVLF